MLDDDWGEEFGVAPVHVLDEALRFPSTVGHVVRPLRQGRHRRSRTRPREMLGGPLHLSHGQGQGDNDAPTFWDLTHFPSSFIRFPYREDGDTIVHY
jgi:hypothetical protein